VPHYGARLVYFDVDEQNDAFIDSMGGKTVTFYSGGIEAIESPVPLNPFMLPMDDTNQMFLFRWMVVLLKMQGLAVDAAESDIIKRAVEKLRSAASENKNLQGCVNVIREESPALAQKFVSWLPGGDKGFLFGHTNDVFAAQHKILHLNLGNVFENQTLFIPLMAYLLQRFQSVLDGKPTVLVMQEAWQLLQNTQVGMNVSGWMDLMTAKNVSTWWLSNNSDAVGSSTLTPALMPHIVTKLFIPEQKIAAEHQGIWGLSDMDMLYLDAMNAGDHHFMIKQEMNDAVIALMNINRREKSTKILQGIVQKKFISEYDEAA
jgi:type IV secretion system protein VirB4